MDRQGSFWIGDVRHNRVLRFIPGKKPQTVAGSSDIGDRGPATAAVLAHPGRLTVSAAGDVFISDALHHRVRRVDAKTGRITTVAGTGVPGYNGDGIPGERAQLHHPGGVLVVGNDLYIADYYNNRVRRVDLSSRIISTVGGNGVAGEVGDGGPAASARMLNPHALTLDEAGNLIVTSAVSPVIRRIELREKLIHSLALDPRAVPPDSVRIFYGIARWKNGFFLADGMRNTVFFLDQGELKDVLPERRPQLNYPMDVAVSPQGDLYICDTRNNRVVRWNGRELQVVAENLGRPRGIALDPKGQQLYIADTFNNRVLKLRLAEGS
jgi:sugar lactone lactonase YvrE